jgi:putative aldouronate transport system substrate-binding protein
MKRLLSFLLSLTVLLVALCLPYTALAEKTECPVLGLGDFFPLEEPLTLTALVINTPGQLSVTNSYVIQWIKEKTNIDLQITYELYDDDGAMQLGLLMASADKLPDILLCTRWSKAECSLYGAQGLVIPLEGYLADCENWNRLTEICGERHVSDLTMSDGSIYCYGSVNECYHLTHQARMWVYQPWIDKLCGGVLPRTTEEFYVYLQKVATMDPNGNGIADEIPLTGQVSAGWAIDPFTFLSNSFVHNNNIMGSSNQIVAPGCYVAQGGEVRCNWVETGYRDALAYMNRLYREGLLDNQTYTQNGEQMDARVEATPHLVGAVPGGLVPEATYAFVSDGVDAWKNWTCLPPLAGPDGTQLSYQSDYDYFYNCNGLVTRDCAYPEIAVQLFDLLSSTEGTLVQSYGTENVNWTYRDAQDGEAMNDTVPLYEYIGTSTSAGTDTGSAATSTDGWPPDVAIGSSFLAFRNAMMLKTDSFNGEQALWDWAELYEPYSPGAESVYPNIAYTEEELHKISLYTATIDTYVDQATVQFITGSLNTDTDWDAYIAMLNSLDQSGYQALLQSAYDEHRATEP